MTTPPIAGGVFASPTEPPILKEETKGGLAFKRKRKYIFLLSAKGSENDKGGIFRVAPFVNPKTPHTPTNGKRARGGTVAPLSKGGGKGNVNKRTSPIWKRNTSKKEVEAINGVCVFLRLRRGEGNRSARVLIMQFSAVVKGAKILAGPERAAGYCLMSRTTACL